MKKHIHHLEPDFYYHIYNRGINGGQIFFNDNNCSYFLKLLKEKASLVADFYCYCILSNHFHILVKIKSEEKIRENFAEKNEIEISKIISQQFSNAFNSYTQAINKHFGRTGKLFELPFRRKLITSEEYLIKAILYIHNNPKKHFITNEIFDYSNSSLPIIVLNDSNFIKSKEVIELFGDMENLKIVHQNYNL